MSDSREEHAKRRALDSIVEGIVMWDFEFPKIFTTAELTEEVMARLREIGAPQETAETICRSILRLNESGFLDKVSPTKWRFGKSQF